MIRLDSLLAQSLAHCRVWRDFTFGLRAVKLALTSPFIVSRPLPTHRGGGAVASQGEALGRAPLAAIGVSGAAVAVGVLVTALATPISV